MHNEVVAMGTDGWGLMMPAQATALGGRGGWIIPVVLLIVVGAPMEQVNVMWW